MARHALIRPYGVGGALFGLIFVVAGCLVFYFVSAVPIQHWKQAQSWVETPCEITRSEVASHRGKSTTYSVNIQFRYEFNGNSYTSDRYNFDSGSSSGYDGKAAVVAQYPVGARALCYVDPDDPTWAVINREWSWMYAIGGFGLIFVVVGLLVSVSMLRSSGKRDGPAGYRERALSDPTLRADLPTDRGARELASEITPKKTLISSLLFTIFWYAILGVVGWAFLHDGLSAENAIPAFVVTIMSLGGLIGVAGVVRGFLGLWNPRVRLRIEPGVFQLGGTVVLTWEMDGDVSRLESLKIYLQGKEHVTYRQGTNTSTANSIFEKITIAEATVASDFRAGRVEFAMPEFTMHSLDLPNNKIQWAIRVEGSIPKWPDVEEEFPVQILPLPLPTAPIAREAAHA